MKKTYAEIYLKYTYGEIIHFIWRFEQCLEYCSISSYRHTKDF